MFSVIQWRRLILLCLFCCAVQESVTASSEITLMLDRDYFNPFAASAKYNLKFNDTDKNDTWNVIYTIMDNRTGKVLESYTFPCVKFGRAGELYFYIRNQDSDYEYLVCLIAKEHYRNETSVVGRLLKMHSLHLPLKKIVTPEKKELLFTIKPCLQERMNAGKTGYDDVYVGLHNGTCDIDWSFFIEFRAYQLIN